MQDRPESHVLASQFDLAARDARDVQQIVDQPCQVIHLPLDDGRRAGAGLVAVRRVEQRQRVADRRQRVAQLVREDGDELVLAMVGLGEACVGLAESMLDPLALGELELQLGIDVSQAFVSDGPVYRRRRACRDNLRAWKRSPRLPASGWRRAASSSPLPVIMMNGGNGSRWRPASRTRSRPLKSGMRRSITPRRGLADGPGAQGVCRLRRPPTSKCGAASPKWRSVKSMSAGSCST